MSDGDGPMPGGEELFDRGAEYDAMLDQGLRLTGEDKSYFIRGRLALLRSLLSPDASPRRVLDFGCGTGDTTAALAAEFTDARVTGVDTAERALEHAARTHAGPRVDFRTVPELAADPVFDLCYVNGVFHHIPPELRPGALGRIRSALAPDGRFVMFENNPWNPGTRMVMRRIPFDRDAETISPPAAVALLRANGFAPVGPARHVFFFPAPLRYLRPLEPYLRWLPLGGQYAVIASTRPDADRR